ncbi:MAG: topoisomerase DNA-binding C4 zinc finger domain-containing protein, partial [Oscillospiraceae bacterium]|nr:topoisomerase DNA-binding C4 zinc finger domain-containing protein [Oscillospiraceae bacterium]
VYDNISVEVESGGCQFRAGSSSLKFPGYTAVYEEAADDDQKQNESRLPELKEGQTLLLDKTVPEQQFTQPPARYTEATLIRAMEEKGIGRPSTYAPTISTITSHDYVIKEGKYLRPTPLGEVVTKLMKEHFSDIVDLKFTNHMEARLDEIESGKSGWQDVLTEFYEGFDAEMKAAEAAMDGQRIKVPDIVSDEICDVCGKPMLIKKGRFGNFLGCSGFPECTFTKPIVVEMPGSCPKCGSKILKRTSKKGYVFYACERGTDCGFITWDVPTKNVCPECGKTMFKRSGRGPLKSFCINEACPAFVPEEKRRYPKKETAASSDPETKTTKKTAKPAAKKTTAKKTAAKKTTAKKTASKKPKEES